MKRIGDEFLKTLAKRVPLEGKAVLEIGCGDGRLATELAPLCKRYVGIEPDEAKCRLARAREIPNTRFYRRRAEELPFVCPQFDVAIFALSLHHIPIPAMDAAIENAAKVVESTGSNAKEKGHVVFLEPGTKGSFFEAELLFNACDGDERFAKAAAQQAICGHPWLKSVQKYTDQVEFRFLSVTDFLETMQPKQNHGQIPAFLNKHKFVLTAQRTVEIFQPA